MKVVAVGQCDRSIIKGMTGKPVVLLEGSIEEIRASARFLYGEAVDIVSRDSPMVTSSNPSKETSG